MTRGALLCFFIYSKFIALKLSCNFVLFNGRFYSIDLVL